MNVPLTVVVPVFNEERTIDELLARLDAAPYPNKQVIVVDDASTDRTALLLKAWEQKPGWVFLRQDRNRGKGAAVRLGLQHALGDVTVVQDADLEYDPSDLPLIVEPVLHGSERAVYGSRNLNGSPGRPWYSPYRIAVFGLNQLGWILYGQRLSDHATCYKAMQTSLWRSLNLRSNRFELCVEITAKLGRHHIRIREIGISYRPRTRAEGKKIGWRDAVRAAWTLVRWRFVAMPVGELNDRTLVKHGLVE